MKGNTGSCVLPLCTAEKLSDLRCLLPGGDGDDDDSP